MPRRTAILLFLVVFAFQVFAGAANQSPSQPGERHFTFDYTFTVHNTDPGKPLQIWIPLAQSNAYQDVRVVSNGAPRVGFTVIVQVGGEGAVCPNAAAEINKTEPRPPNSRTARRRVPKERMTNPQTGYVFGKKRARVLRCGIAATHAQDAGSMKDFTRKLLIRIVAQNFLFKGGLRYEQ